MFQPHATDADGDRLKFSILNKPKWMWFDTRTGTLKGRPKWAQRGRTFAGIVIRVSDGKATRALPAFDIKVGKKAGDGNTRPTISGTPPARATVGKSYFFTPTATDRNGDSLTFSILNKPAWARFAADTGTLSGTPTPGSVGTHGNIVIRVADGKTITSLRPFSIAVIALDDATHDVTLTWTAPTRNTNGSALTDLAGYQVLYGVAPGQYSQTVQVRDAEIHSVELQGLASGTWYFAIRSVNRAGIESARSDEISAVL